MDVYIERTVKVRLEMSATEFIALKDLVLIGRDLIERKGISNVEQTKVIGKIVQIDEKSLVAG
jgi:hypothetical protein